MAVSMEVMLELWSLVLRDGKERLRPLFKHVSVADSAASYIDGLFGPERRKTGWMRAEAAGDAGPWRQQAVVGRSVWPDLDSVTPTFDAGRLKLLGFPEGFPDRSQKVVLP
jgi:SRSO17 transposase